MYDEQVTVIAEAVPESGQDVRPPVEQDQKKNVLLLWTSVLFILVHRLSLVILFILPKILEVPSKVKELMFIMQVTGKLQHMV